MLCVLTLSSTAFPPSPFCGGSLCVVFFLFSCFVLCFPLCLESLCVVFLPVLCCFVFYFYLPVLSCFVLCFYLCLKSLCVCFPFCLVALCCVFPVEALYVVFSPLS